ncbi:MAG: protein kinase [Cyanobacteria bacterium RYN_339]|nr:protein kinase [Cyanobacteria bacterium RYN_339]
MNLEAWPAGAANFGKLVTRIVFTGPTTFVATDELGMAIGVDLGTQRELWRFNPAYYSGDTAALPGGAQLLTGAEERLLRRVDAASGRDEASWLLPEDVNNLEDIVLAPDGRLALLQVGLRVDDGEGIYGWSVITGYMMWDLEEGRLLWRDYGGRDYAAAGCFSLDGRDVMLPRLGGRPQREWRDVRTGEVTRSFERPDTYGTYAMFGSGERALVELSGRRLVLLDVTTGGCEPLPGSEGHLCIVAAKGYRALTVTLDGQLMLWDLAAGRLVDQLLPAAAQAGYPGAFLPDGSGMVLALVDGSFLTLRF